MAEKSQNADSGKEIKEKNKKINKKEKTTQQQKGLPTLSADLNERALAGNSNNKYQCKSNCTKIKHIKDSHLVRKYTGRGDVWVRIRVFFFFFFFFFFNYRITNRTYVWICVSVWYFLELNLQGNPTGRSAFALNCGP